MPFTMATEAEARQQGSVLSNWGHVMRTCGPPEGRVDPISKWLVVTRACVQPMTLTAIAIAGLLAVRHPGFEPLALALAALGLLCAHAANNAINDYFDLSSGLDTEDYPRALYAPHPVLTGLVSRSSLVRAIVLLNVIDATVMVALALWRGWPVIAFALAGLVISVGYVAPPLRLKAKGLGEPSVFIVWGPLMVGGTFYSATGSIPGEILIACIPYALLVTAVLVGKHIDKAPWDGRARVRTLPVLLGERRARRLTDALNVSFYFAVAAGIVAGALPVWAATSALALPTLVRTLRTFAREKPQEPPRDYPVWPLWFVSWAFLHARRAGALLVLGLALGAIWPRFL